ncbi:ribonuclease HII [Candidatus Dependentiae bacterium]|nr:ribonuclease HII [Candidatus Dependentiae bacterium]
MTNGRKTIHIVKDHYENTAWQANQLVLGIDEVGRGCLCGPLVCAAVILHPNKKSRKLKDSKLLDKHELQDGYNWIVKNSWYEVAISHHRFIDQHNIYQATLRTMHRAVMQLIAKIGKNPDLILVDALPLKVTEIPVMNFPHGEKKSSTIAAASIIAKVTRDIIMQRLEPIIPGYYMGQHKGYATKLHLDSLTLHGQSFIHRKSFLKKINQIDDEKEQQTLW